MFSAEGTIALIMMEILLLVGFLGVIIVITRFSNQSKENADNMSEVLIAEMKKLKDEIDSYRDEIYALQRMQKEKNESSNS